MKNLMIVGVTALAIGFVLLLAPLASAQGILNGQWFEVKVKTKTLWWQSATTPKESRTDSFTAYMQLAWQSENQGVQEYDCAIWTQDGTGAWVNSDTATWSVYNENDKLSLAPDFTQAGAVWYVGDKRFTTDANFLLKIATDTVGVFKKATFSSMGCNVTIALPGGSDATGGCSIKGKSLKESPFS